jgi:hypothetical protein
MNGQSIRAYLTGRGPDLVYPLTISSDDEVVAAMTNEKSEFVWTWDFKRKMKVDPTKKIYIDSDAKTKFELAVYVGGKVIGLVNYRTDPQSVSGKPNETERSMQLLNVPQNKNVATLIFGAALTYIEQNSCYFPMVFPVRPSRFIRAMLLEIGALNIKYTDLPPTLEDKDENSVPVFLMGTRLTWSSNN